MVIGSDPDASGWLGLKGRVVVITGAGGGIGRAVAGGFARAGVSGIALLDRDGEAARDTGAMLEVRRVLPLTCDVADPAAVAEAAGRVAGELGPVDVLVNNAGVLRPGALATLPPAEWNALLGVNLTGYFLCAQAFGRTMLERRHGAMVHVASIAGSHAQGFSGAYSVSKAGVIMLSRQLALEWGESGIRSNVVSPGLVRTPMSEAFYRVPGVAERRARMVPLQRVATPDDIAEVVLFLASPRSGYVTVQEILVDGGFGRTLMDLVPRPGFDRAEHTNR
ncbi:MAG: SDR family NAD(P)-dependent oxidoreductase [Acetobacteraceae bacterium]